MLKQFWSLLSRVRTPETAAHFFSDLLSDTEEMMLAKRLAISLLLLRGKNPTDIHDSLNVSYTTIGSVGSWVKNAKPKTKRILEETSGQKDWDLLIDKIEAFLDKLPPPYHSDWELAGKAKYRRSRARSTRDVLR